ncbi:hypothetical protein HanRHA438_Chr00c43g0857541 [Helianthus annuus]|nr:hypothetical protein HanHA89_Chr05g0207021 [Helianthus annuus]KAJ0748459.1 hypothetical protein HanOQP8_Chr05g0201411 [Helianthus annuus]KAJ0920648.1 hypothetical protein HanRHA438_Chr05g0243671 [Helianthus annuus]KAJ0953856.1 hypothetical protein HanRHA438_Chr00c43g0857541 [Helianthus annuus]
MIHIRCSSISVILFPGIQAKVRVSSVFVFDNVFVTTMDRPGVFFMIFKMDIRIRKLYLFYSYHFLLQGFSCYCVIQMLLLCFIMYPRCSTKCLSENVARLLSFFNALLGACVSTKKFDKVDGCESGHCFIKYHGPGLVFLNVLFC